MSQKTPHATAPEDRIPVFQKFIYSMGSLANDSQAAWIGQMVAILILGLQINPFVVGLIGCVPRIFDAIIDPVVGFSSDNSRTRWGRRRPFIFFGAIASGICYIFMFQLYPENSNAFNSWYFLIFQILFFAAFTCYSIPWIALGYEMTPDYHERTSLQSWGRAFAQVPWLLAPWAWTIMFEFKNPQTGAPDPVLGSRTVAIIIGLVIIAAGVLPAIFNKEYFSDLPAPVKPAGRFKAYLEKDLRSKAFIIKVFIVSTIVSFIAWSVAYFPLNLSQYSPLILAAVFLLSILLIREVSHFFYAFPVLRNMFDNIGLSFKNKLFVKLCATTFLIYNGFMLSSTFILYVIFYHVFKNAPGLSLAQNAGGKLLGIYGSFSAICTVCVVSFIPWLSRKLGKKGAFFITIPLSIIGYSMKWLGYKQVHESGSQLWEILAASGFGSLSELANFFKACGIIVQEHYLLLACAPLIVFGLGSLFTIILSMIADVCDIDELETGQRREGMFSAVYWWMVKLGLAMASLIGGAMLVGTGFKPELELMQAPNTLLWMRIWDVSIPVVTSIAALYIIKTFDMSEEKAHTVRKQIERRREDRRKEERRAEERRAEERRRDERRDRS